MLPFKDAFTNIPKPKIAKLGWADCPASFFVATPDAPADAPHWQRGWAIAAGRGLDETTALVSTVAEAIERMSIWSRGPEDGLLLPEIRPYSGRKRDTNGFLHFSERQLRRIEAGRQLPFNEKAWKLPSAYDGYRLPFANLLTGETVEVGVLAGLFGEELRCGATVQLSSSSGTAVHETFDNARQAAVLERVERDAVAIWWYHRLTPSRLTSGLTDAMIPPVLGAWLRARTRRTHFLDLPSDLPASVVVAVSYEDDGSFPAIGLSAGLSPQEALVSAALEMLQGEISLRLMTDAQALPDPPPVPPLLSWSRDICVPRTPFLMGVEPRDAAGRDPRPPFAERVPITFDDLLAAFERSGITILVADITRPEFGVPCCRAISPELRDWAPRFAPGRLYEVPVALGLVADGVGEDDLNPVAFVL